MNQYLFTVKVKIGSSSRKNWYITVIRKSGVAVAKKKRGVRVKGHSFKRCYFKQYHVNIFLGGNSLMGKKNPLHQTKVMKWHILNRRCCKTYVFCWVIKRVIQVQKKKKRAIRSTQNTIHVCSHIKPSNIAVLAKYLGSLPSCFLLLKWI